MGFPRPSGQLAETHRRTHRVSLLPVSFGLLTWGDGFSTVKVFVGLPPGKAGLEAADETAFERYPMNCSRLVVGAMVIGASAVQALGQTTRPATAPATRTAPADEVAVIVNGQPIMESQIDGGVRDYALQGRPASDAEVSQMRSRIRGGNQMGRLFDFVIEDELVAQDAKRTGAMLTDKEFAAEMEKRIDEQIKSLGMTREQAAEQIKNQQNKTFDEFVNERSRAPRFRAQVLQDRALHKKSPDELKVTDDDVKKHYDQNLQTRYTRREDEVKASHILLAIKDLKTRQPLPEEVQKEKRKKAEEALAEVKKPGADFAALASKYSEDPVSKARGGDLNFFTRQRMVKPFSDAAFNLKVGEMSDIVESEYGYHIIKVTDRHQAGPIPFDEIKDSIRRELEQRKLQAAAAPYRAGLRKDAKIVYPPGKELATQPSPMSMSRPAPRGPGASTTQPRGTIRLLPKTQPSTAR